jgi:hypothetical protein
MLLGACGSSSPTSSATSATSTKANVSSPSDSAVTRQLARFRKQPEKVADLPALPKAPPKGRSVYYINTGSGAAKEIGNAIRSATQALGWRYKSLTYNAANPASGNSAYLTAVNAGANGIISTGLPAAAIQGGMDAAHAKHVDVVLINGDEPPATKGFQQVGNTVVTGKQWARAVALGAVADAAKRDETAHIGVITSSGIPVLKNITDLMVSAVGQVCAQCSAQKIDVSAADLTSGQASKAVVSFIQRNPKVNYVNMVFGAAEGGLRPALDAAGLSKVQIVGTQPTPAQNAEVRGGGSLFWVQIPYGYEAWGAVDALARASVGADADLHNGQPLPVWLVDKQNLSFDPGTLPEFPRQFRTQFQQLWKVG